MQVEDHQKPLLLERCAYLTAAQDIIKITCSSQEMQFWFRGPRPLGDFLSQWSQFDGDKNFKIRTLPAPKSYIAILPDDMLAIEEIYLGREGTDIASKCPKCGEGPNLTETGKEQSDFSVPNV